MGCTASKLENEDTVRRCKDRRRLMKEAVHARHHLAAAHSDYCQFLRLMGSALSSFAAGEPLSVSDQTPAVFLHPPPENSSAKLIPSRAPPSPSPSSVHPPPPPLSPSITSSKLPQIISASSIRRRKQPPKLPHILSESSPSSSPRSERSNFAPNFFPTAYQNSTYSTTPSQASSVWNWENFYPPSPPDSEFFNRKARETQQNLHRLSTDLADGEETETERPEYHFFQMRKQKQFESMNSMLDGETEREEVQYSEWEDHDHYSTTSSSEAATEEEEEERESMSEIGTRSDFGSSRRISSMNRHHQKPSPPPQEHGGAALGKYDKADDAATSSGSYRGGGEIADMKMVLRHKDLKEIVDAIKENFDKAAAAGDQVSKMLEIGRAQLDRSFSQLKSEFDLHAC